MYLPCKCSMCMQFPVCFFFWKGLGTDSDPHVFPVSRERDSLRGTDSSGSTDSGKKSVGKFVGGLVSKAILVACT